MSTLRPVGNFFFVEISHKCVEGHTPRQAKLFLGGIPIDSTRAWVSALVTLITGCEISIGNIHIFPFGKSKYSGSCVIHLPCVDAATHFMAFNKLILCENDGIRIHDDVDELLQYSLNQAGSPHPLVVEQARPMHPPQMMQQMMGDAVMGAGS